VQVKSEVDSSAAQAVSHWLPTTAGRVRSYGICGVQSDTGEDIHRVLFSEEER
jgi:hypothetical protein